MITKMKQILGAAAAMLMLAACGSPKTNLPLEGTQWKLTEMDGKADPDYARCVDLCTKASLHEMILPTIIAVVCPIVVGLILGHMGVVGMLAGATVTGFLPQGRRGGRHRGRSLQGYLRPRYQHPHQAAEHGLHRVRRSGGELPPAVKNSIKRRLSGCSAFFLMLF